MERDAGRLLLDEQAVGAVGETLRPASRTSSRPIGTLSGRRVPSASRSSSPCEPEKAIPDERQMPFEVGERTSADDGEPPVESAAKPIEQRSQLRRDANRVGRLGQLDQGPVEIEEQCRAGEQVRRR